MLCVVTGWTLAKKCPVKTCLYYSEVNKTGCCARDAEGMSLDELSVHKNEANVTAVFRARRAGVQYINGALMLYEFLAWATSKSSSLMVSNYSAFAAAMKKSPILGSPEFKWTKTRIRQVLNVEMWEKFYMDNPKMLKLEMHVILGLTQRDTSTLLEGIKEKGKSNGT